MSELSGLSQARQRRLGRSGAGCRSFCVDLGIGMHVRTVGAAAPADRVLDGSGIAFVLARAAIAGTLRSPRWDVLGGPLRIAEITNRDDLVELSIELDKSAWQFFHNLAGYLGTHRSETRRDRAVSDRVSLAQIDAKLTCQLIKRSTLTRSRTFTHDRSNALFF